MMHDRHTRIWDGRAVAGPGDLEDTLTAGQIGEFFRRRRIAICLPMLLALATAYGFMQLATPTYMARAQIIIDPRLPQFIPGRNVDSVLAWDSAQVESEIAVLQSERIAAIVVTKLKLDQAEDFRREPSLLAQMLRRIGWNDPSREVKPDRFREALAVIDQGLSVRRTGLSYAINVTFSSPNALRTQQVANAIADAYIADQLENKAQAARLGGDWLQQRMISLRSEMNVASRAVQAFRASHNYGIPASGPADPGSTGEGAAGGRDQVRAPDRTTLDELEASYVMYRRVYESFLQSFTESVQRQSFPVSDAHILAEANLPDLPASPRAVLIYPLAGLIGCLAGFGLAIGRHQLDRTIRRPAQITSRLGIEGLGTVSRLSGFLAGVWRLLRGKRAGRTPGAARLALLHRHIAGRRHWWSRRTHYFTGAVDPRQQAFAQGVIGVKVGIDLAGPGARLGCIGVTAASRGEGVSTLASNLGTLYAELGARTLVVDANLERRSLTRHVRRIGTAGLVDVLGGTAALEDAVVPLAGMGLDFLPGLGIGSRWRGDDPLLARGTFKALLRTAADSYDAVIVDLPPAFPIGGVLALSPAFDGLVIAVESGRTTTDTIAELVDHLGRAHAKVLGFAITKAAS